MRLIVNRMLRTSIIILGLFSIIYLIGYFNNRLMFVNGYSMSPTLKTGDLLILNPNVNTVNIYDIIVFKLNNELYVKRVIASGKNKEYLMINDHGIYYYLLSKYKSRSNVIHLYGKIFNLKDKYWMQGDGIHSTNSDTYGPITKDKIVAKVVNIIKIF